MERAGRGERMDIKIYKAEADTGMNERLLSFVRGSSWDEGKEHTAMSISGILSIPAAVQLISSERR